MDRNEAIELAIDSMRRIVEEKRRTTFFPDNRAKLEEKLKVYDEAIVVLEGLKNGTESVQLQMW